MLSIVLNHYLVYTIWHTLTVSLDGMCNVFGPALPINLFSSLILANVPRAITSSFPRLDPYELNSRGLRLQHKKRFI